MKNLVYSSALLIMLVACKKESTNLSFPDHIMAGQNSEIGVSYSGLIHDKTEFLGEDMDESRVVDIKNDGIDDFEIRSFCTDSPGHNDQNHTIKPLVGSCLVIPEGLGQPGDSLVLVDTLELNHKIDNTLEWSDKLGVLYKSYYRYFGPDTTSGYWRNMENTYVGTKTVVEDQVLYGWIQIELTEGGWNLNLEDYACTTGY